MSRWQLCDRLVRCSWVQKQTNFHTAKESLCNRSIGSKTNSVLIKINFVLSHHIFIKGYGVNAGVYAGTYGGAPGYQGVYGNRNNHIGSTYTGLSGWPVIPW